MRSKKSTTIEALNEDSILRDLIKISVEPSIRLFVNDNQQ